MVTFTRTTSPILPRFPMIKISIYKSVLRTERLRADLWKCFEHINGYGKDTLLLTLLAYNVGVGRLLGYGKHPKRKLLRKIEAGDRNFYREYVSFCRYKGKVLRGLVKRRQVEYALFYLP